MFDFGLQRLTKSTEASAVMRMVFLVVDASERNAAVLLLFSLI